MLNCCNDAQSYYVVQFEVLKDALSILFQNYIFYQVWYGLKCIFLGLDIFNNCSEIQFESLFRHKF